MALVIAVLAGVAVLALVVVWLASLSRSAPTTPPAAARPTPSRPESPRTPPKPPNPPAFDVEAGTARALREVAVEIARTVPGIETEMEREVARLVPEMEAEAARIEAEILREVERAQDRVRADIRPEFPKPDGEPVTLGPNGGPTWMFEDEWADKVAAYRGQGRTAEQIREVAEYLERRGPTWPLTPAERTERAERLGMVIREEYMSPEHEALALEPGPSGYPDARVQRVRDRLLVVTPDGWVNPRSRTAASHAGLWSFSLRGTEHHESAARRGDFTPGAPVRLVRKPDNPHDPNAIAVYAAGARDLAGYVPRGYAKRLAKLLDAGADMVAVSTRGGGPGYDAVTPHVLAVERDLWEHLNRGQIRPHA